MCVQVCPHLLLRSRLSNATSGLLCNGKRPPLPFACAQETHLVLLADLKGMAVSAPGDSRELGEGGLVVQDGPVFRQRLQRIIRPLSTLLIGGRPCRGPIEWDGASLPAPGGGEAWDGMTLKKGGSSSPRTCRGCRTCRCRGGGCRRPAWGGR